MKIDLDKLFLIALLILICLFALLGCNAKKSVTERTIISDTLKTVSVKYETKPIETNYTFDLICDTLTGKIRPVNFTDYSGDNSASLVIENNQLKAMLKVAETESKTDTIYISRNKDKEEIEDTLRFKTPLWHWLLHIILVILLFLYVRRYILFI